MARINELLAAIDAKWKPLGGEPFTLQLIGSGALMLQCQYERGTKDGDILESKNLPPAMKEQILSMAGKGSDIRKRFGMYIDVVDSAILFLPQKPIFHPMPAIVLKNFKVEVLDIVDVLLSKLKRCNNDDKADIRAMSRLFDHAVLVERFKGAADWFSMDARAADVPRYLRNLHNAEREILLLPSSDMEYRLV